MKYNLNSEKGIELAKEYLDNLVKLKKVAEIKNVPKTRSNSQNRALHLYFRSVSEELNELGITHEYKGISGKMFEVRFNPYIVKNFIWRPLQIHITQLESTTKINTNQINEILETLALFFAGKGIVVRYPSIESLFHELDLINAGYSK